jgi:hypothetical protein
MKAGLHIANMCRLCHANHIIIFNFEKLNGNGDEHYY